MRRGDAQDLVVAFKQTQVQEVSIAVAGCQIDRSIGADEHIAQPAKVLVEELFDRSGAAAVRSQRNAEQRCSSQSGDEKVPFPIRKDRSRIEGRA